MKIRNDVMKLAIQIEKELQRQEEYLKNNKYQKYEDLHIERLDIKFNYTAKNAATFLGQKSDLKVEKWISVK